jgi:hypothetical protein
MLVLFVSIMAPKQVKVVEEVLISQRKRAKQ